MRACSCRDVGAGGNGSRLPVCTWHGIWGMSMLQDAGCRLLVCSSLYALQEFGMARLLEQRELVRRVEKTGAS